MSDKIMTSDINQFKDIYISRIKALNSPKRIKFCAAVISN